MTVEIKKSGFVGIVGRPNVGKSTLMNHMLGQKLSITSHRPQTTRHRILGIHTENGVQTIYVDTPGIHTSHANAMNKYMNRAATSTISDVDIIIFIVEGDRWTDDDQFIADKLKQTDIPLIVAVNKIDLIKDKKALLPVLQSLNDRLLPKKIVPISAEKEVNLDDLQQSIDELLPDGVQFYPDDQITDRSERFIASEIIREKLTRQLGKELPYALTVEVEQFKREPELLSVAATILVERKGQKVIVIGKKGEMLKLIGQKARLDMEKYFSVHVYLNLWVKVKEGWSDDERALKSLGYNDE